VSFSTLPTNVTIVILASRERFKFFGNIFSGTRQSISTVQEPDGRFAARKRFYMVMKTEQHAQTGVVIGHGKDGLASDHFKLGIRVSIFIASCSEKN
jgi:hypothetical protein